MNGQSRLSRLLGDMIEFTVMAELIVSRGKSAYDADVMLRLASEAVIIRLGEAAARAEHASPKFLAGNTDIDFQAMRAMRNFVAHQYDSVNHELLWTTMTDDLPGVRQSLEKARSTL